MPAVLSIKAVRRKIRWLGFWFGVCIVIGALAGLATGLLLAVAIFVSPTGWPDITLLGPELETALAFCVVIIAACMALAGLLRFERSKWR